MNSAEINFRFLLLLHRVGHRVAEGRVDVGVVGVDGEEAAVDGEEVLREQAAVTLTLRGNDQSKINIKRVEGTTTGRGDMTRKWRELVLVSHRRHSRILITYLLITFSSLLRFHFNGFAYFCSQLNCIQDAVS
jgi:hypothetical protein